VQRPRAATLSLPDLFPLDAQGDMDIDEIDLASSSCRGPGGRQGREEFQQIKSTAING
jgi:hypothetical protein